MLIPRLLGEKKKKKSQETKWMSTKAHRKREPRLKTLILLHSKAFKIIEMNAMVDTLHQYRSLCQPVSFFLCLSLSLLPPSPVPLVVLLYSS